MFIVAGIGLLVYSTTVSQWLLGTLGGLGTGGTTNETDLSGQPSLATFLPVMVFGFALALLGIGGNMFRGMLMAPAMGAGMGGSMASPDEAIARMEQQMAQFSRSSSSEERQNTTPAAGPSPTPIVKVKCRTCGYLEREGATYCSSCGQPI